MPHLGRVDAMPMGALAAGEQEIDRSRGRASVACRALVAEGLAEMPAFGMRPQVEQPDDVGGAGRGPDQDRFFRSRTSAKSCAAGRPARPTAAATAGTSARRKTLARFSAPIVVGIVGWPAATWRLASSARARRSGLSGSMVSAKRILASVYSWPQ